MNRLDRDAAWRSPSVDGVVAAAAQVARRRRRVIARSRCAGSCSPVFAVGTRATGTAGGGSRRARRGAEPPRPRRRSGRSAATAGGRRRRSLLAACDRPHIAARQVVLPPDEVTIHHDIPVTTVARTLFDLAGVLTPQQLEAAITEAEGRRLGSPTSLADLVARHPHHRGVAALKTILLDAGEIGRTRTRSELEIDLLALVDAHGLPRPRTNGKVGGHEVDAVWA